MIITLAIIGILQSCLGFWTLVLFMTFKPMAGIAIIGIVIYLWVNAVKDLKLLIKNIA